MRLSPRARFLQLVEELRTSYWFVPALMTASALLASLVMPSVDGAVGNELLDDVSWLYTNKPEGARSLLATIAGSMITVAGVTFSITIAAVAYASQQLGPRLLYNFMRDRGNQVTLGTFISTFVYCLMILRTIRAGDDATNDISHFVPHLSIALAVLLALLSVGVLIYFVHHIPHSIQTSNVVSEVGRLLNRKVEDAFVDSDETVVPDWNDQDAEIIVADGSGSLQYIDLAALAEAAADHELKVATDLIAGDFILTGQALARVWIDGPVDDDLRNKLRGAFVWGDHRTQQQDVRFIVNELVEIAARALSPGVNDPFTAIHCIDELASGLLPALQHHPRARLTRCEDGELRVFAAVIDAPILLESAFGQLQPYAAADPNVAAHFVRTLARLRGLTEADHLKVALTARAAAMNAQARECLDSVGYQNVSDEFQRCFEPTVVDVFTGDDRRSTFG